MSAPQSHDAERRRRESWSVLVASDSHLLWWQAHEMRARLLAAGWTAPVDLPAVGEYATPEAAAEGVHG